LDRPETRLYTSVAARECSAEHCSVGDLRASRKITLGCLSVR
jgi:hypothetical protein